LAELEKLAAMGCTQEEAAAWFGMAHRTLKLKLAQEIYREAWENGQGRGRVSLRRAQYQAAMKGDRTMLVWLGKTLLGQTEKSILQVEELPVRLALTGQIASMFETLMKAAKSA
jgi:hypothetical protein